MDTDSIISKLIESTKSSALKWQYLDLHEELSDSINNLYSTSYEGNNSFFAQINNGFFVLASFKGNLHLRVYPTIDSRDPVTINIEKNILLYQDELLRLLNLIKKQYPQIDDIFADLLNDNF